MQFVQNFVAGEEGNGVFAATRLPLLRFFAVFGEHPHLVKAHPSRDNFDSAAPSQLSGS